MYYPSGRRCKLKPCCPLQEEASVGRQTWQKLCYAVDCHDKQRAAYLELQEAAAAIAAERDEALSDLDAALGNLDAAEVGARFYS